VAALPLAPDRLLELINQLNLLVWHRVRFEFHEILDGGCGFSLQCGSIDTLLELFSITVIDCCIIVCIKMVYTCPTPALDRTSQRGIVS